MAETETQGTPSTPSAPAPDLFSKEERAYFESRGEQPIPAEAPSPKPEETGPAEPVPVQPAPDTPETPSEDAEQPERLAAVDHGAFHRERERRKAAEDKLRQAELTQARMEERMRLWAGMAQPPPQPQPKPPSPDEDIFGAVKHLASQQQTTTKEINEYKRQMAVQAQQRQLVGWAAEAEAAFKKTQPDYDAALKHLRDARRSELELWGMPAGQTQAQLDREEMDLLYRAANERRNPAELAYNLARHRGFQPGSQPSKVATPNADAQLDRVAAGQQSAGRSLSGVGGSSGTNGVDITAAEVLKLPEPEFAAWIKKNPAKWRRMKGG